MKKHLIIAGIICAATIPPTYAVTKCVKLTSSTTCNPGSNNGVADWSATCTTSGSSVFVKGISFCSNKNGNTTGTTSGTLSASGVPSENSYCWCKIVSPAISSSWVFYSSMGSSCPNGCSSMCAGTIYNNATFRKNLFSGLSD
ncbi:MAG TPA: hypothetical protein IAD02_04225 [Candidatus Enterousia intestinigallinarum]|uniref:Uncharacterized protein n=1 Tax=Candidatus Enterousia intestinigallinarum TaxID=2840790 RepID=A0A9D1FG88_9PROT|nr:hypothetical protein [Candidatus Enterousia intestinigallinarum]